MMKKLYVCCGTLESGGAERVISILSNDFVKHFDLTIVTWRERPVFYKFNENVKILSIEKDSKTKNIFKKILWFRHFLKNNTPDLILSFLTPFNMLYIISVLCLNIPIVVAERNDPRILKGGFLMKFLRNVLYHKAKGILIQTEDNKNYFRGSLNKRCKVIYNPIIMDEGLIGSALKSLKDDNIVSVGRLHPQKNQMLLLKAFKELHVKYPNYTLTIYGKGECRADLEKYISANGLNDLVSLPGNINDVFETIIKSKIFVLSSDYEGMPNALIEAMCLGLPCISTKVSGATELIKNNENGILIDVNNVQQLTEGISKIIDSKDFSMKISKNAVKIFDYLKCEVIVHQWIDYLNKIMY